MVLLYYYLRRDICSLLATTCMYCVCIMYFYNVVIVLLVFEFLMFCNFVMLCVLFFIYCVTYFALELCEVVFVFVFAYCVKLTSRS
jgi:hypothetical protein